MRTRGKRAQLTLHLPGEDEPFVCNDLVCMGCERVDVAFAVRRLMEKTAYLVFQCTACGAMFGMDLVAEVGGIVEVVATQRCMHKQ